MDADKDYRVVAPEGILWALKPISKYWTEVAAGPDLQEAEVLKEFFGTTKVETNKP